ncbi:TPA: cysteine synthase A [Bacillus tropicus]|uniref:cysteine synthase A n=1 Tax=Bacillus cereus group TaxID=86661 RepID=UPI00003CB5C3|nr:MULTISPECIES: cysteine synthase A [Bacillus cereus group]AIY72964.1 cysteine synthase A [Bacillus cereus]AJI08107.1 cysteine synthase A [Bacillus cereus G9241]EAL15966.1 cysteine synthase A [Bacillus cereus G9241]QPS53450.1 cysteine synthase A [Bacillus tropicus]
MEIKNSITELIGKTPVVKLNHIVKGNVADIYLKLEFMNPGSSVKDRIALAMIEDAEKKGVLKKGDTIIEATSGNTGISLAMIAAAKNYKSILVMPDTMSVERRNLLSAYGAKLILTPGHEGMSGAIQKANELAKINGYFIPQQFKNQTNPEIHRLTTGPEIVEQMGNQLDVFIAGVGTGGTITGAGSFLKEVYKDIKICAVEPADSPVLSGGKPKKHQLQGIGAGFVPETLDVRVYDEVIQVRADQAFEYARKVACKEGILLGISAGAAIYASVKIAKKIGRGKKILTIIPSNGERYLSTMLYRFEQ